MSDTQDGPNWWKAVDGKWYPPERHPDALSPAPPPVPAPSPPVAQPAPWARGPVPPPAASVPGYPPPHAVATAAPSTNGFAVASLVMGIVGFFLFGVGGLLAIIFGHVGRRQIRRFPGSQAGSGLALAGLILGYLQVFGVVIFATLTVIALGSTSNDAQTTACSVELDAMQTAAAAYRAETGAYPISQTQLVGTYLSKASTNYDYAPDGSGAVVTPAGSRCE